MQYELVTVYHNGQKMPMTPVEFLNDLVYANYTHNRRRAPEITAEQWEQVYGKMTQGMEARYQMELLKN